MTSLDERLAQLTPKQRELLRKRLEKRADRPAETLRPRAHLVRVDTPPLSYAQQRLWILDRLEPGSATYNVSIALRIEGHVDPARLRLSIEQIVHRHEVLRTTFPAHDGVPFQRVSPIAPFTWDEVDCSMLSREEREAEVARHVRGEGARHFDLARGPLFVASFLTLDEAEHFLILTWQHAVFDGWSIGIFAAELGAGYQGVELPPLPMQYVDYAIWQREWLDSGVAERQLAYWRERLAGLSALDLPTDRPRSVDTRRRGGRLEVRIDPALTTELRALARSANGTLFMVVLAGWLALLARYSGQRDIAVGVPTAGRSDGRLEELIGFFVNTLVMRVQIDGDATIESLLERVRDAALGAYAHQDVPFDLLVDRLKADREAARTPWVRVMMAWQNTLLTNLPVGDLKVEQVATPNETTKFDLMLYLGETTDGAIAGELEYDRELFDPETIGRMAGHFLVLLSGMIARPGGRIRDLPLLTVPELGQLRDAWSSTRIDPSIDACVHELFAQHVNREPDAVAIVCDGLTLTYGEVNARATLLAQHLRSRGVLPETRVALLLERGPDVVVAMLAVLAAGGTYVPLETSAPMDRLRLVLEDSGAKFVIARGVPATKLPIEEARVVRIDAPIEALEGDPAENALPAADTERLAYIMYTSGSSGKPKGAMIPHRAITRLVRNQSYLDVSANDVFLQYAPLAFDASTLEIWAPLANGAAVAFAPPGVLGLEEIGAAIRRHGVTVLWLTAGLFAQMVDARLEDLTRVRCIIAGGDVLPEVQVAKAARALPTTTLINGYGPTENTTFTCCYEVVADAPIPSPIPIGRPIANTTVYVLDAEMRLVPIGVPGELFAGGAGLARGYTDPERTTERFLPNPFDAGLLYRTGDRVRWRGDGKLEFLGRADRQVKIRGYRVELEEIEAALARHPSVRHVAVVAREERATDTRLVAYYVPRDSGDAAATPDSLRRFLAKHLPAYMIPSAFVALDEIPLTANGKLDRGALPAPVYVAGHATERARPRDTTEELLLALFCEVLGVRDVGVHENFFASGGHSLLAAQLVAAIDRRLGVTIPLDTLFRQPTIAELATAIRAPASAPSVLVPLQAGGERRPFFCVHGSGGHALVFHELARALGPEQPFFAFQAKGWGGTEVVQSSIEEMSTSYLEAMQSVQPRGPYRIGGWSFGALVALEMAQRLRRGGETIEILVALDASPLVAGQPLGDEHVVRGFQSFVMPHLPSGAEPKTSDTLGERIEAEAVAAYGAGAWATRQSQVYLACMRALAAYSPSQYPGPVTLFRALGEAFEGTADWRQYLRGRHDMGWSDIATGGVAASSVPGTHESMLKRPHVQELARQIRVAFDDK
jgi:amino acid adenylation domain-containing protein